MTGATIRISMRGGGEMGGYLAQPDGPSRGSIIAIMEIWGVNETMRRHADEFAAAGYTCLVPDIFWRQEPGVDLDPAVQADMFHAFDLYYTLNYDKAVEDMEDAAAFLSAQDGQKVGAVGYCLGGKLCYLMCCRTEIDCAVGYYGTYIEHSIGDAVNLHRPFLLHTAGKDDIVPEPIRLFVTHKISSNPCVTIYHYPDAGHAFARSGSPHYRKEDTEVALKRTLAFFGEHLG
jgi:carboxymethylenebutenolidase